MADVILPPLPAENEDPWYQKRQAFDLAVKTQLEGPLNESQLNATIDAAVRASIPAEDAAIKSDAYRYVMVGDSLTRGFSEGSDWPLADAWPAEFSRLAGPDVTVENLAVSGQTIDENSIRLGALQLVAQSGFTIPADTSSTSVTIQSGVGWRPSRTWTFEGSFLGVPGVLTRTNNATTALTFARSEAGSAVNIPAGTPFVSKYAIHQSDSAVIFLGRNDVSYSVTGADGSVVEHVLAGYERLVGYFTPRVKRLLLCGTTTATSETTGTPNHTRVTAIAAGIAERWPEHYTPLREYLVERAIYDLAIAPTGSDQVAMAGDTIPPSLMVSGDSIHYSKPTARKVGEFLFGQAKARQWLPVVPLHTPTADHIPGAIRDWRFTGLDLGAVGSVPDLVAGLPLVVDGAEVISADGTQWLSFDGVDDYAMDSTLGNVSQPYTVVFVAKVHSLTTGKSLVGGTAQARGVIGTTASSPGTRFHGFAGTSLRADGADFTDARNVFIFVANGENSVFRQNTGEGTGDAGPRAFENILLGASPLLDIFAEIDVERIAFLPYAADEAERDAIYTLLSS